MSDLSVKHCPKCHSVTQVRDSRTRKSKGAKMQRLGRRRVCPKCGYTYSTVEMPESEYKQLMTLRTLVRDIKGEIDEPVSHSLPTD